MRWGHLGREAHQVCTGALVGLLGLLELPGRQLQRHAVAVATVTSVAVRLVLLVLPGQQLRACYTSSPSTHPAQSPQA